MNTDQFNEESPLADALAQATIADHDASQKALPLVDANAVLSIHRDNLLLNIILALVAIEDAFFRAGQCPICKIGALSSSILKVYLTNRGACSKMFPYFHDDNT